MEQEQHRTLNLATAPECYPHSNIVLPHVIAPTGRVSRSLHKCSLDAAELEKMQSNLRSYSW